MKSAEESNSAARPHAAWAVSIAVACALAAAPALAQTTGVSMPDQSVIDQGLASPPPAYSPATAKPSAGIPATQSTAPIVYGPYVPYRAPGTPIAPDTAFDPDANIVTQSSIDQRHPLTDSSDPDADIVTSVPAGPNELPDGTLVKVRLLRPISTLTTEPGTDFAAVLAAPILRNGQVLVPEGSVLRGRITQIRGGHRIAGAAAIHLQALTVTLPDGGIFPIHAQVIDTNSWDNTRVDNEGTILRKDHAKSTLAMMSITTGSAIAAGALIAGAPGALIGAGVGAGVSTIVWLRQSHQAVLPQDLGITFSLTMPLTLSPATAENVLPVPAAGAE